MYNLREKRRRDYKELNNGLWKKQNLQSTPSLSDVSSADTLVSESLQSLSSHEELIDDNEALLSDDGCEQTDEDEGLISEHEQGHVSSEVPNETDPQRGRSHIQADSTTDLAVSARQTYNRGSSEDSTPAISQTLQIPSSTYANEPIICQNMSGQPLQRAKTATINQTITIPTHDWIYPSGPKRSVHDSSLQPEHFYHHSGSSDSDEQHTTRLNDDSFRSVLEDQGPKPERAFIEKFGFDFEEFSINPFAKPSISGSTQQIGISNQDKKRFETWLTTSPWRIWVTKVYSQHPFALCKFDKCEHRFTLHGNPTSSNIIRHLKRQHNNDYELFFTGLKGKQKTLEAFSAVRTIVSKPFPFAKRFLKFLSLNNSKLHLLNVFIEGFIPFSLVESQGFRLLLDNYNSVGRSSISSRKGLVSLLAQYETEFSLQLKQTLRQSSNFNLLIDMWTSSNQRSYLAVMVCFCPNLNGKSKLSKDDVNTGKRPNTHILDFIDLSSQRHSGDNIKTALLSCLTKYSISHKVSSITLDNGSNNISMLEDLDKEIQNGFGSNGVGSIVKVRCMNHVLNRVFLDLLKGFEMHHKQLLSRIDKLTHFTKSNVYIRSKIQTYIPCTIPKHNNTRFISRYRQLDAFLKVSKGAKEFFFENRFDPEYQLTQEDCSIFCYDQAEIESILFLLRLTRIFYEFTMLLQDDSMNSLYHGIEYYMQLNQYFDSCESIKNGSMDSDHLQSAGLKPTHFSAPKETQDEILGAIIAARPKFEKYLKVAYEEPGYWAAHILQPHCKSHLLTNVFDQPFSNHVLELVNGYVTLYIKKFNENSDYHSNDEHLIPARLRPVEGKKFKIMRNLSKFCEQNLATCSRATKNEWQIYLNEPLETENSYLDYWLANQNRFPALCSLALSFFHTKISTADVERCFSISKRVLESRFSLASENLRRTMILRNRMKCFNIYSEMLVAKDIAWDAWTEDEEAFESTSDLASSSKRPSKNNSKPILMVSSSDESDNNELEKTSDLYKSD
ncbi:putative transposase of the Rover1 hAT-like family [Lachancea nothofagi CBS 11611]|uniref:Putative transposase of the Rover1 hAT-like family n=2 Tax=Lachancea nothofagi TaxID=679534 RepID=A0A1G4KMM8_9SACH|nr:putative transposase of the Rover1 hAT-like family [Lachancea nothofagi]SCV05731.1 putative transposase of the Rover1 hAT-like family [Lachancea nothofagi CBS 11611]